ncbi:MAG: zinc ribbon domain-containing protein [Candidatus Heimdallarchaeota archaeon]|nr:zinc ribbon domain-containing protein [Candidatus Heimdallarchaeota archaeon]
MPLCPNCGSSVDEGLTVCPFCQAKLPVTTIPQILEPEVSELQEILQQPESKTTASVATTELKREEEIILHTPTIEELEQAEETALQEQTGDLEIVPERRYWLWFLLGVGTVGIIFLIYLFVNIEDLERHSYYPLDSRAEPINVNTSQTMMIFLVAICFGFIPILWWIYYKKYASLYDHLKDQKKETAPYKVPRPIWYMLPLISSHLLALIPTIIGFATGINIRETIPGLFWSILAIVILFTSINFVLDFLWQRAFNAHLKMTMAKLSLKKTQEAFPKPS